MSDDRLLLESDLLRVEVEPDRGAQIRFAGRPGGVNALAWYDWDTPIPQERGGSYGDSELDWLSRYRGGWQELFPNAGAAGISRGIPMAFHGDVSHAGWDVVAATDRACILRVATRLPLILTRTMRISPNGALLIEEEVENESDLEIDFLWGHHPVFPVLPGARIDLPDGSKAWAEPAQPSPFGTDPQAWPNLTTQDGSEIDLSVITDRTEQRLLYLPRLPEGWAALRQPGAVPDAALAWDTTAFPDLWLWLQNGTSEFPWFGRARMLGIEPQTSSPFHGLAAAQQTGRAHRIGPRARRSAWVTLTLFDDDDDDGRGGRGARRVTAVRRDGSLAFEDGRVDPAP